MSVAWAPLKHKKSNKLPWDSMMPLLYFWIALNRICLWALKLIQKSVLHRITAIDWALCLEKRCVSGDLLSHPVILVASGRIQVCCKNWPHNVVARPRAGPSIGSNQKAVYLAVVVNFSCCRVASMTMQRQSRFPQQLSPIVECSRIVWFFQLNGKKQAKWRPDPWLHFS